MEYPTVDFKVEFDVRPAEQRKIEAAPRNLILRLRIEAAMSERRIDHAFPIAVENAFAGSFPRLC